MSKIYYRNNVIKAVEIVFPAFRREIVLDLLNIYGRENHEYEKERVQLAIIKISKGDIQKLKEYVELAKIDYRDVLMSAEYNQDGSEIMEPYKDLGV